MELALNNLQRLICHKTHQTKPNQTQHEVNDPKVNYSGDLGEGKVGHDQMLEH